MLFKFYVMEKFRKIISFFNKLGLIFWCIGLFFKILSVVNDEVERKFGKKDKSGRVVINNPFKELNEDEEAKSEVV